jgi:hypothetical protein
MLTVGPIATLRLGMFLCCCETEENRNARIALAELSRLGQRVDWHTGPSRVQQASGFVKKLFGSQKDHTDAKPPTLSHLVIVDNTSDNVNEGNPFPELQLKPLPRQCSDDDDTEEGDKSRLGGLLKQDAQGYHLGIPLHRIVSVDQIEPTMLVIIAKDIHSIDEKRPTKEAARISFGSSNDRDAVCMDLKLLVEWNKQRQPDIEEELPGDGLRAKAQKAAHFARRELELRETKRSREQRKAKFMSGSTGLKYTAMAMANRAEES